MKPRSLQKTFLLLLALPFLVIGVKKIIELRKSATGSYANILIDTKKTIGPLPISVWQNLAQGGEEAKDMIAPVLAQTMALKPQYVRIDHLFDYFQVYKGPDKFDFSKLDPVIDTIISTGAIPFLSLSYTPAIMTIDNKNASQPKEWNQWYLMVKATANRYSVQKNIKNIYYEVWNEPDLFGGWHYSKTPSYTTLYTQTAQAVVDGIDNSTPYKVGGPATTAFYKNWVESLFKTSIKNNLPLDFISYHQYSKNINNFQKDIDQLNQLITKYPRFQKTEIIISEYGPTSEPDAVYDNQNSAIHLLSLTTNLVNKVDKLFTFEIVDGPNPRSDQSSGWGLLTHPQKGGRAKPRYQAIQFLNRLQGQQLSSDGNGSWVSSLSSKTNKTIQTILVNYDPKNIHYENVPVSFQRLTPGRYQLKTTNFLGNVTTKNLKILYTHHTEFISLLPNSATLLELTLLF